MLCDKQGNMWSCGTWVLPTSLIRSPLECGTGEGESPVGEGEEEDSRYPEYCCLVLQQESTRH